MNAVVYARYSSHRQGEQSIEGQLAEAKKYAEAHGLTIIHEYCDRAQTGRNDDREQFQRMLSDAAKHAFDALIVWKTDRIGRNKEEIALNKYHLKKNGVKIHYIAEMIPTPRRASSWRRSSRAWRPTTPSNYPRIYGEGSGPAHPRPRVPGATARWGTRQGQTRNLS